VSLQGLMRLMRIMHTRLVAGALPLITASLVVGCGGSSSKPTSSGGSGGAGASAQTLLRETFTGKHPVKSGDINFALKVVPSGSSELTAPITISFGGPFQSGDSGKLPESDFTVTGSAQGESGKLSIISTGNAGYIAVDGVSYQLPAKNFKSLESSLGSVSGGSSKSNAGALSSLGIHPLDWLTSPKVVGQQSIGGVSTTHISAAVNVPNLLKDIGTLIGKAAALGGSSTSSFKSGLSSAEQSKIAGYIKSPTFDVWTGNSDQTLRKLAVGVTVPLSGSISKELGGLSSAKLTLSFQYSDINQPQTITAPTNVKPYAQFQQKIASVLETVEGGLGSGVLGSSTTSGSGGSLSGEDQKYSNCITKASGNVAKMQKCSALLTG
jgi:hypothetical protein